MCVWCSTDRWLSITSFEFFFLINHFCAHARERERDFSLDYVQPEFSCAVPGNGGTKASLFITNVTFLSRIAYPTRTSLRVIKGGDSWPQKLNGSICIILSPPSSLSLSLSFFLIYLSSSFVRSITNTRSPVLWTYNVVCEPYISYKINPTLREKYLTIYLESLFLWGKFYIPQINF